MFFRAQESCDGPMGIFCRVESIEAHGQAAADDGKWITHDNAAGCPCVHPDLVVCRGTAKHAGLVIIIEAVLEIVGVKSLCRPGTKHRRKFGAAEMMVSSTDERGMGQEKRSE